MHFIPMHVMGLSITDPTEHASILARIGEVLKHGQFILGPEVAELEQRLEAMLGNTENPIHCVTCGSGTDALRLALMAGNIGVGHAVILPAFGFAAATEAVMLSGAAPLFVDVNPVTFNLEPLEIRNAILQWQGPESIKAIIAIDTFGLPCDYHALQKICDEHQLFLIEDAAQSLGAKYFGRAAGTLADIAITSFYPTKPLGAMGDGGALFTSDNEIAIRLRQLRNHGQTEKYHHNEVGLNSRLDTVQAAILLHRLDAQEDQRQHRAWVAAEYKQRISLPVKAPISHQGYESAWSQYSVQTPNRDQVQKALAQFGIPTHIHYPNILPQLPAFAPHGARLKKMKIHWPCAEDVSKQVLSLPMHSRLQKADIEQVVQALSLAHAQ